MTEPSSLPIEHRLRLAELATQLTIAASKDVDAWSRTIKNTRLHLHGASVTDLFDLIYDHLLDKVGLERANTEAAKNGSSAP